MMHNGKMIGCDFPFEKGKSYVNQRQFLLPTDMIALVCGNSKITVRYVLPDAYFPSMSRDVLKRPMTLFVKMAGRNAKKRTGTASQLLLGQGAGGKVYASIKVGDRLVIPVCKAWELKQCASLMGKIARPLMCYLCKYFCPVPSVTVRPFL